MAVRLGSGTGRLYRGAGDAAWPNGSRSCLAGWLGQVVGQPTAGWIIFTGGEPLIDGSMVRVPSTRIRDGRGQDMEMHPRPVDIAVDRPLGETETGGDAQLSAAVKALLAAPGLAANKPE